MNDVAGEVEEDDVIWGERVVGDAAGLDGDESLIAEDGAGVAPGEGDEALVDEGEVGAADVVAEGVDGRHGLLRARARRRMSMSCFMTSPRGAGWPRPPNASWSRE